MQKGDEKIVTPFHSFCAGACGGLSLVFVSHPFDLVKILQQNGNVDSTHTFARASRDIFKRDGLAGLYKGVGPVALGTPLIMAVNIYCYSQAQRLTYFMISPKPFTSIDKLAIWQVGIAGSLSSVPTSLLVGPAELIKVKLQTGNKGLRAVDVVKTSFKNGHLTRGLGMTLGRDCCGSFFYFGTYEGLKRVLRKSVPSYASNPLTILLCGGIAGMVNWTIAMPFDNIKTRLQANSSLTLGGIVKEMNSKGWKTYFTGLRPTLLRAFPASAAFFGGMEGCLFLFRTFT